MSALNSMNTQSAATAKNAFSTSNMGSTISSGLGGIGSIIGDAIKMSEIADTTDIRDQIKQQQNYLVKANTNEDLLSEWSARRELSPLSYDQIRGKSNGELALGVLGTTAQGASTGLQMAGPWGALGGAVIGLAAGIGGAVSGNAKAKKEQEELNRAMRIANANNLNSFNYRASTIDKNNDFSVLYNYAAYGGALNSNLPQGVFARNTYKLFDKGGPKETFINWDNTIPGQMINFAENRDSIGWNKDKRIWETVYMKGFDENNFGMGVDKKYLKEDGKSNYIKTDKNGRTYITEEDERNARFAKLKEAENSYKERVKYAKEVTKSTKEPSEVKKALVMSAIYNLGQGAVARKLFEDKQLMHSLFDDTDEEFANIIHQYYDKNSPKAIKPRAERIQLENEFIKNLKAYGGDLYTNGLTFINNGDSHESNPNKGVQVGIDKQGIPNLVEEGEVIWNDYVFSNRLKISKSTQEKYNLKEMTFADAVKKLQKESEERPNDPISKEGLTAILTPLIEEQEKIRLKKEMNKMKKQDTENNNIFDKGGPLADVKFLGTFGDYSFLGNKPTSKGIDASFLRYAPVIGSAIGATQSLLSTPDYSNANEIAKVAREALNYKGATYKPLGDFMDYTPFDKSYYTNKLQAESNALRRAISNQGGPSVNASLLAADYNTQTKLGELFRQAEEYNVAQKQKVKEFNRGTKAMNAEMLMKASLANQEAKSKADALYLQGLTNAINMKEALATADATSDSQALSSLFTNLGNIGTDAQNRKDRDFYIKHVVSNLPMDEYINIFGKTDALTEAKRRGLSDEQIKALGL